MHYGYAKRRKRMVQKLNQESDLLRIRLFLYGGISFFPERKFWQILRKKSVLTRRFSTNSEEREWYSFSMGQAQRQRKLLPTQSLSSGIRKKGGRNHTMREEGLPQNCRQMGGLEEEIGIYLEDYVYTYLKQFARNGEACRKTALLCGRHITVSGQDVVLISGAMGMEETEDRKEPFAMTAEEWEQVGAVLSKSFPDTQVVGWAELEAGFGAVVTQREEKIHSTFFSEPWQVLFVMDSSQEGETYFLYPKNGGGLRQARGFFLYYEKNQEMQEYMLQHPTVPPKEAKQAGSTLSRKGRKPTPEERIDAAEQIRAVLKKRERQAAKERKHRQAMLTAACVVLCGVMLGLSGAVAGSLQRLEMMETKLSALEGNVTAIAQKQSEEDTMAVGSTITADPIGPEEQANHNTNITAEVDEGTQQTEDTEGAEKAEQSEPENETTTEDTENTSTVPAEDDGQEDTDTSVTKEVFHTVEEGDNLRYISNYYYGNDTGIEKIMEANNITDPNLIYCGQVLMIP